MTELALSQPKRVQDLWFADGDVVLQAEDHIFRVRSKVLAEQSSELEKWLGLQKPDDAKTIEDCPVLLFRDTPEDLGHFLKAIFDPSCSFWSKLPVPPALSVTAAVLRLSTKYEVAHLRRRALKHMALFSPLTLHELDSRSFNMLGNTDLILRLNIAIEFNLTWAMPLVMYWIICSLGYMDLRDSLRPPLQHDCIFARAWLAAAQKDAVFQFLRTPKISEACTTSWDCLCQRLATYERAKIFVINPLACTLDDHVPGLASEGRKKEWEAVCEACRAEGMIRHQNARHSIWSKLPEVFHLPSWVDLQAARAADLKEE
ncbi:hypothetical protein FB45DRAFT_1082767, partial [Roridomyces roridus]